MSVNIVAPDLDVFCEACLSSDRKITREDDGEMLSIFYYLITDRVVPHELSLCWECKTIIKKFIKFKLQVNLAYETITKSIPRYNCSSLSQLSIRNVGIENFTFYPDDKNWKDTISPQDVTFIKVEDDIDDDEIFADDEYKGDEIDDKHVAAVLTSNNVGSNIQNVVNKIEDDFDESDEEPLNNKKRQTDDRERKKIKQNDASIKIDRRKYPAPKKEKPPGVVNNPRVRKKLEQLNMSEGQLEMVVLSWDEVEEERQKALNSIIFTRHEYRCYDCVLGFNHRFKLDNHMKKHELSSGEFICSICKIRCRDAHALCAHKRRHRVRWRCRSCGDTSSRAAVAADHFARAHHSQPPTHTCAVCGHCAGTLGKLRNHMKNHAERQKCELCSKTFRDRTSLKTHLFIHKGEKEYSCPRCNKQFLFKKAMEVHLVTHDASAHLYCYECDMNFKNRMSFTQHMKYSLKHIDPSKLKFACDLCNKRFAKCSRLEEHKLAVHLKVTPVQCAVEGCAFTCSSRPVLRTHVRMVHRNARALRNHVCDACGKTYTTKKTLEGHIRSHTGERPFKCPQCPSSFGYEAALYNHNKFVHLKAKVRHLHVKVGRSKSTLEQMT